MGRQLAALAAMALAFLGCVQSPAVGGGTVRVVGAWQGSELDAFMAVVDEFEARTGINVAYTGTRDLRGEIEDGLARGTPPDLAGLEGPAHMRELSRTGALRPLTGAIDVQGYKSNVAPTFVELGSVDGRLVGAFVKSTLKGLIWYNPAEFRMGTPHSFDELMTMTPLALKAPGTRTWCVGLESAESSGWPGTDWIETFVLHDGGLDWYDRWVAGEISWSSEPIRRAFESFGRIVAEDAVHGGIEGTLGTNFADAGEPLFDHPPGCLLMMQGSFMPAYFEANGRRPGSDYDFFPVPEMDPASEGAIIGGGDLIGLLTHRPQAAALMDYLLGAEAQQRWVTLGGALSVNRAVTDYPSDVVAREAELLTGAAHFRFDGSDLMPPAMNAAFWEAVLDFTEDQSRLRALLESLDRVRVSAYGR